MNWSGWPSPPPLATHVHLGIVHNEQPVATPSAPNRARLARCSTNGEHRLATPCSLVEHRPATWPSASVRSAWQADRSHARRAGGKPLVADESKNFSIRSTHHHTVLDPLGLSDRRVATASGPEPVTGRVERRLHSGRTCPRPLDHPSITSGIPNPRCHPAFGYRGGSRQADTCLKQVGLQPGSAQPCSHSASISIRTKRPCSTPPSTNSSIAWRPPPSSQALPSLR